MLIFKAAAKGRLYVIVFAALCTTILPGTAFAAPPTQAPDVTYDLDIPAQSLKDALLALALASKHKLLYSSELVDGKRSSALKGRYTTEQAVKALLTGTRLSYEVTSDGLVLIRASNPPDRTNTAAPFTRSGSDHPTQLAQANSTATATTADAGRSGLAEIVVSAEKREERLIDTPQSISVLFSGDLRKLAATQFRDFANTVPGLTFNSTGAGYTQIILRGVTVGRDVGATVGIYVDEVPYGSSTNFAGGNTNTLDPALFDLDRVEVLRGPQGTLYGASTMGGLIKYVTTRPETAHFGGDVQTGVSDTHDGGVNYDIAAAVNMPIVVDKAAVRVSAFQSHDGGYIDNVALDQQDVNRSNIYGGRLDFLVTPTDALNIRIAGFSQDISRGGESTADYGFSGAPLYGSVDQYRKTAEPFVQHFRLGSLSVADDLDWATLTSISSYQTIRTQTVLDLTVAYGRYCAYEGISCSSVGLTYGMSTDKFVQEVRLASKSSTSVEWLIGGFYTHEHSENLQAFTLRDLAGQLAPNDILSFFGPSRYQEYATFGDGTWHLTGKFDVSAGIRYARNNQDFAQTDTGLLGLSAPVIHGSDDVFTYLADARYHFSDHATGYLRYATGYRPGGPNFTVRNAATGLSIGSPTFQPDSLRSYEIGLKTEAADRRFSLDLAGYYIDWNNIQISVMQGGFGAVANAPGGATVRGSELTLTVRPVEEFTLTGAFAYQDARLSQAEPDLGATQGGQQLPNVPRYTGTLNADYHFPVTRLEASVGATVRYVSDRMASFNDSAPNPPNPQYRLPEYRTVDLRTDLVVHSVGLQLYVHNLLDERGQLSAFTWEGLPRPSLIQPRTLGMTVSMRF